MSKTALITGIAGQDGAYLAQLLLEKGYRVVGGQRRTSLNATWRMDELGILQDVELVDFELGEMLNIFRTLEKIAPDEIYNLGAQSYVATSFEQPLYTSDVDALGVTRLLEAVKSLNPKIRFYQASTSEMFGKVKETPQNEDTPFHPRSPYGVAKLYGHWITTNYREAYGLHASSGILFNHESPFRGINFVTRKITLQMAEVKHGKRSHIELGNLDARRDWGYAKAYVKGMWQMVQKPEGGSYVLATGETNSVRSFVEATAKALDIPFEWSGKGQDEIGLNTETGKMMVKLNPAFIRPAEVDLLLGDAKKARTELNWDPELSFDELVRLMAETDEKRVADNRVLG